jgi:DNA-binding MarR family transcriptional regulator
MTTKTQTSDLVKRADEIRGLCALITKAARRDAQERLNRHEAGLTAIEYGVLRRLAQGIETMAEIGRVMAVPAPTLVYVVDGLVAKGLVSRGKDLHDRRREPLSLLREGKDLLASIPDMDSESALVRSLVQMKNQDSRHLHELLLIFASELVRRSKLAGELSRIEHHVFPRMQPRNKNLKHLPAR